MVFNQYAPSSGVPALQQQIAQLVERKYGLTVNAEHSVTVTSGATEALYVAIQALVSPEDEVIVFDPAYDSYKPAIELAGGKTVHIALTAPDYKVDCSKWLRQLQIKPKPLLSIPHITQVLRH